MLCNVEAMLRAATPASAQSRRMIGRSASQRDLCTRQLISRQEGARNSKGNLTERLRGCLIQRTREGGFQLKRVRRDSTLRVSLLALPTSSNVN